MLVDRIQIQQVVLNLIRNSVEAMAEWRGANLDSQHRTGGAMLEIAVSDTGPGLARGAEAALPALRHHQGQGHGVGLSICRSIIDAHGGRLWATANDGGGVSFRFTLPIAEPAP